MPIESLADMESKSQQNDLFSLILENDCVDRGVSEQESWEKMKRVFYAIRRSVGGYSPELRSASGMAGGDGAKMRAYVHKGQTVCGEYIGGVIAQALEMAENNACMKCIVAAPTAGSCGVLPAVLLPFQQKMELDDDAMIRSLYIAGMIGEVIAKKAGIAGASCGCQAEIGTAGAMAAGALCYLNGGTMHQIAQSVAFALKAMMGLVCDPVAGLVEVPCVKRNAAGAMIAMSSADMALAGIESAVPPDEVISAMRDVGNHMDESLRETGRGGVGGTPFGIKMAALLGQHAAYEHSGQQDR